MSKKSPFSPLTPSVIPSTARFAVGETESPKLMRATGDGRYHANIDALPEGAWRITVQSATPARPAEPVSDWVLVWKDAV